MALNNAIVRNKTIIQEILSADPQFILGKVIEKELITGREYTKLNSINKGDAEDLVIKLVDILINKGRQSEFIGLLQDEKVLETYPKLEDVEWGDIGSTASSRSLSIGHGDKTVVEPRKKTGGNGGQKRNRSESEEEVTTKKPCTVEGSGNHLAGSQEVKASFKVSPTETKGRTSELILSSEQFKTEKLKDRDNIYAVMAPANRTRMALLITNVHFDKENDRDGAEKDEEDMSKLLISLGYNVERHRDLSGAEMDEAVKRFSKDPRLATTDSVFVVIMSHGVKGAIVGVHHCDGVPDQFPIDNIYKHLDTIRCPKLINKPKVIIIQACRGDEVDADIEEDAIHREHKEKDMVSLLSCTADTVSYRHSQKGSFLIQHLVEIFKHHAHEDHIDELFRKVLKRFEDEPPSASVRQMAVRDRCTLTKHFYLFPRLI
uniref:Caspase-1 n=1 Tax=Gadus morhua TaxID=8049 RepID=A0A8C4Z668_GADMO